MIGAGSEYPLSKPKRSRRAVSPAISSAIITAAVVVMLLVTVSFANNYLSQRIAENEFSAMKQFMQTVGLQLDDVAWTIGRTQTVRYATTYGTLNFESSALNYTVFVNGDPVASFTTGFLVFNMPTNKYNMGNHYYQRIFPSADSSFLQEGTTAPVSHVYVIEIVPMNDGNYIRVVVAPSIRLLSSTITTGNTTTNYYNMYLPILEQGVHPRLSESVTLQGTSINLETEGGVNSITVTVDFPKSTLGFDQQFFNFENTTEQTTVAAESVLEFYTGEVIVSLGLQG